MGYKIGGIYQGGYSAFESLNKYSSTGSLGETTDPRSANILQEVSSKLASGTKHMEIEAVSPEVFDSMPKQQLKEVNRLSKLTGVDISLHGPVIDTSGITQQGFSELNREASEKRIIQTLKRGKDLKPEGNIPIVFHSAEGIPGSEYFPGGEGDERKAKRLIVVNRESGKMAPLETEKKHYPDLREPRKDLTPEQIEQHNRGEIKLSRKDIYKDIPLEEGKVLTPEKRLQILNTSEWDNSISQMIFNKERADEILEKNHVMIQHLEKDMHKISPEVLEKYPELNKAWGHYNNAKAYLDDVHMQISAIFSKAYEFGTEQQQEGLKEISNQFKKKLDQDGSVTGQSKAMNFLIHELKNPALAPDVYVPIEKFAAEQSSKTFGNAAFEAYKKFKDKTPTMVIENPPAGFALSTGEDLRNLIKKTREQFIKKAIDEGMSKSAAQTQAEKLIGATWDVGHINMLRKQGFEEKDIIKETEKIAPFVKHVHLSDNFGFEHTELPMGMGNVPLKEIMEKLGKKGYEAKKIIEAGNWWQHFRSSPFQSTLEYMGTPIYATGPSPYWSQTTGFQQGYMGGYGMMLPQGNYETFGAGFSQLPAELGGQRMGGQGGRMSGRPME